MKTIYLIRHAESTANAGAATSDFRKIPLTPKGHEQAEEISKKIEIAPNLIIVSPFLRAQMTSTPTLRRFPDAEVEVWDQVGEFTYLSPDSCKNTTAADRRPRVDAYWAANDPNAVDGPGAESFADFTRRATDILIRFEVYPVDCIVLFSHAQFINSLLLYHEHPELKMAERMQAFHNMPPIANGEIHTLTFDD